MLLLIAALVCFLIATFVGLAVTDARGFFRVNLVALGLAFWVLHDMGVLQ